MEKIQFLTILLTVTCFLGCVVSVTDKEFQVSVVHKNIIMLNVDCTNIFIIKSRIIPGRNLNTLTIK